jgi:hypothetical protein
VLGTDLLLQPDCRKATIPRDATPTPEVEEDESRGGDGNDEVTIAALWVLPFSFVKQGWLTSGGVVMTLERDPESRTVV